MRTRSLSVHRRGEEGRLCAQGPGPRARPHLLFFLRASQKSKSARSQSPLFAVNATRNTTSHQTNLATTVLQLLKNHHEAIASTIRLGRLCFCLHHGTRPTGSVQHSPFRRSTRWSHHTRWQKGNCFRRQRAP